MTNKKMSLVSLVSGKKINENIDNGLSIEQKKKMYEAMKNFSKFKKIYREDITDIVKEFVELADNVSKHMVSETEGDWVDKNTMSRQSKLISDNIKNLQKVYKESFATQHRMESLFEDTVGLIKRYYEVKDDEPQI